MGITAVLENEDGTQIETIEDPTNVLHRVLPNADNDRYDVFVVGGGGRILRLSCP